MGDYSFGGSDEENAELKKLNVEVLEDQDSFDNWEKLVRAAESLEGGLNRNSSPQSIVATRDIYDRFLAKFPLLFGYWKKYADLEFSIAGTEAAELVYERGVASITNSVDLWTNYCAFKVETSHDSDVIRELFERGATCVGLDFLAHPFWDKYLEFEERLEANDKIFAILDRVVHIPMHQYARYFERYRQLAQSRPLQELLPSDTLAQFRAEIETEALATVQAGSQQINIERGELEIEREMRTRIDNFHLEIFARTQTETTKRWTYESEVKRPYFHVTELDEGQLVNWRKYLDFEEVEGDYIRTQFLYERCLVTCAYYDEFWLRYARWMLAQQGKEEEVRNIYQRASMLYAPISRPAVRLQYAYFEEMFNRVEVAKDIHQAILVNLPGHIETIVSLANLSRRHGGLEAAIEVYKAQIDSPQCDIYAKAALVAEWARLLWKIKGSVDEARQVFQRNQHWYLDSRPFWINFLLFELEQPTSAETESTQYQRIKQVHEDIRRKSHLPPLTIKDLSHYYMLYLLERGTKDAAKEYLTLDREVNGPFSVQSTMKAKLAEDGKETTTQRRLMMENGHPGVEVDEAAIRRGENPYTKYYQQQGEHPLPSGAQEEDNLEIHEEKEEIEVLDGEVELLATREVLDEESEGNKEVEDTADATLIASDTSETSDWTPINNSLDCDLIYDSAECSGNSVTLQRQLWPAFPDKHGSPRRQVVPQLLSRKTMNQTANIPILASRKRAGMSDVEAMSMWDTWHSLLPAGGISKIKRPWAGHGEKARQQAVVWMAQDTYSALLERTNTFVQQLQLVALWRDISRGLGDAPGVAKIHDLLVEEIGEGGPLLLS
ncbi:hypothetical protein MMC24_000883 [Lignoscripta atroalba]|nr:hypothetical protein [Lignoscripta atroalba]